MSDHSKTETQYSLVYTLTKRDLFAAMAMQGMCASRLGNVNLNETASLIRYCAEDSIKLADALLLELNKERAE